MGRSPTIDTPTQAAEATRFAYSQLCACCWPQVEERAHPRGPRRQIFLRLRRKNDGDQTLTPLSSNEGGY